MEINKFVNNYRTVSLFQILGKIYKKILFNSIFEYLQINMMLCDNQWGFRPPDLWKFRLLSIVHDIYASFDCNPPKGGRGIFLDISIAFDRVWHEGLIFYKVLFIQSFIRNRHQPVLLKIQPSTWAPVLTSVPQGSILGLLFFFTQTIYLRVFHQNSTFLLMIPPFFVLLTILLFQNRYWIVIWKFLCGPINGRCHSIEMYQKSNPRDIFF